MRLKNRNTLRRKINVKKTLTKPIPLPVVFLYELLGRSPDS